VNLSFTPSAVNKILGFMAEKGGDLALRIHIRRTLSGTEWNMALENRTKEARLIDGIPVLVDPKTADKLEAVVIDWVQTPKGPGFGVYNRNLHDTKPQ